MRRKYGANSMSTTMHNKSNYCVIVRGWSSSRHFIGQRRMRQEVVPCIGNPRPKNIQRLEINGLPQLLCPLFPSVSARASKNL